MESNASSPLQAASAAAIVDRIRAMPRERTARPLSPAALAAVSDQDVPATSPIVLAGVVRIIELLLIAAVGFTIYGIYLFPEDGLVWRYVVATVAISVCSVFAFQVVDIYQVQAFRGHEKQYMRLAAAWSVVFLLVIGASFFAKAGEQFSRVWLGGYYAFGLAALVIFRKALFMLVRRWTEQGRLTLRTVIVGGGDSAADVIKELKRQKNLGIQIIGLFDDRGDDRSGIETRRPAQARHRG